MTATPTNPTPPKPKLSPAQRWGIAVLIIGGIAVASNISTASDAPAPKPASPTTALAPTPAREPVPEPAPAPEPQDNGTQAHAWIKDNYSGASWVPNITAIEDRGSVLWAETNLFPDSDAGEPAAAICAALSAYQISETAEGLTGVTVRAVDGQRLTWRMSLSEKC